MPGLNARLARTIAGGLLGLGLATAAAAPAAAQSLDDRFWVEGSFYRPSISTAATISRTGSPGTEIDGENDLGLDDTDNLFAGYAGFRFAERWTIVGEYYALNRDASKTATRSFVFDGATYTVGGRLDSQVDSSIYRVALGYAFYRDSTAELGLTVGLHATDFDVKIKGQVTGPGGGAVTTETRGRDFLAPLPTVGLFGTYDLNPSVTLNGRIEYMALGYGDYDGSIFNIEASAAYNWTPSIAVGASWRYVAYDVTVNKENYSAVLDYNFSGPAIFARWSFQ